MTTHDAAKASLLQTKKRHSFFHPGTLLALGLSAAASLGIWTATNQPQRMPDYTGDVGGFCVQPVPPRRDAGEAAIPL